VGEGERESERTNKRKEREGEGGKRGLHGGDISLSLSLSLSFFRVVWYAQSFLMLLVDGLMPVPSSFFFRLLYIAVAVAVEAAVKGRHPLLQRLLAIESK